MSHIKLSEIARLDLVRLYAFLAKYNQSTAVDGLDTVHAGMAYLEKNPFSGSPLPNRKMARKYVIEYGASGYLIFHKYNPITDTVQISTILHQLENYDPDTVGLDAEKAEGW
jgi:plasmid stabilization system protein ParE